MASEYEVAAMRRAVALAARAAATSKPNPVVGCVLLAADGRSRVGEGWHQRAGGPHAESAALAAAGDRSRGGTAVVTLEPCNHTGRTGPCVDALLAAGVGRVVIAVADPNPLAAGGAAALRAGGVDVEVGVCAAEAEAVNEGWLGAMRLGRPFVTWKYAATLDGRVAAADGTSRWITGPEARAEVHRRRATADAVVAGIGTVLADDPRLTARAPDGGPADCVQPLRVVVDTSGRTPRGARVLDGEAPTLLAVGPAARPPAGAAALELPPAPGGVDLVALLAELWRRDRLRVLLEGGPTLAGSFLRAGLIDRVIAHLAPKLLGAGAAVLADAGIATIGEAAEFRIDEVTRVGRDLQVTARPVREE